MLIFWKARLVLLSMPKTGTTALEAAFGEAADTAIRHPPGLRHMGVARWHSELAPVFERRGKRPLETMALVREPVDWLGSWWRYRQRDALAGQPNSTAGIDFARFVGAWLEETPPAWANVGRQARFLGPGVDHLFRYERFEAAVTFLRARTGVQASPSRLNVSPAGEARLDRRLLERLRNERLEEFLAWEACEDS